MTASYSAPDPLNYDGVMARQRTASSFDTVRDIARDLPGVEEGTAWGVPALKLRGRLLACMASHKSAEPGTLVVLIGFDQRDAMIADDPRTYYVKPHYEDYPSVLVRLPRIERDALKDLLHAAWRFVNGSAHTRKRPSSRARLVPQKRERR
jgi:hypothetical protein